MDEQDRAAKREWPRWRQVLFFVLAVAYAILLVSPVSLLPQAFLGWLLTGEGTSHRVHEVSFGVIFLVSLLGLLAQFRSTSKKVVPMQQVAVPILALIVVQVLVSGVQPEILPIFAIFGIPPILLALLHPTAREVFRPSLRPSPTLLVLAAVLAVPMLLFAVNQIRTGVDAQQVAAPVFEQLEQLPEDATEEDFERAFEQAMTELGVDPDQRELIEHSFHWPGMAAFAFGLVVLAFLVALRIIGFRFSGWSVGGAIAYYGVVSLATPDDASSAGPVGGAAAVAWGIVFVVFTEIEARSSKQSEAMTSVDMETRVQGQ
jgi:hypothetical protein